MLDSCIPWQLYRRPVKATDNATIHPYGVKNVFELGETDFVPAFNLDALWKSVHPTMRRRPLPSYRPSRSAPPSLPPNYCKTLWETGGDHYRQWQRVQIQGAPGGNQTAWTSSRSYVPRQPSNKC